MVLKYILINTGFILTGFLLSYVVNLAKWLGLDDAHDMGLGNLLFVVMICAIVGLVYTGYVFFDNKWLVGISALSAIGLIIFLYMLF